MAHIQDTKTSGVVSGVWGQWKKKTRSLFHFCGFVGVLNCQLLEELDACQREDETKDKTDLRNGTVVNCYYVILEDCLIFTNQTWP